MHDPEAGAGKRVKTKAGKAAVYRHGQDNGSEAGQESVPLHHIEAVFAEHAKDGVVTYDKFGRLMTALVEPLKQQGLQLPAHKDYRSLFRKYDTRRDGKLAIDEWKKLAAKEVYENLI